MAAAILRAVARGARGDRECMESIVQYTAPSRLVSPVG